MYEIVEDLLTENNISALKTIMQNVELNEGHVRVGISGLENMSVYKQSKWLEWDREIKNTFKSNLPNEYVNNALIGWFLHIPKDYGFHDKQDFWTKTPTAGTVISFALEDNMHITLNDEKINVPRGRAIKFNLSVVHEIEIQSTDQNWACLMTLE